jgi:hypothetical protein
MHGIDAKVNDNGRLEGTWKVERRGGLLPPLAGVRKWISGSHGTTRLGMLPAARFDVVGLELHYRFPFAGVVDILAPSGDGFSGRTVVFGREVGTFRMTSVEADGKSTH